MVDAPDFPALAVRPTRCKWSSRLNGGSNSTTLSTPGKSRPRAATSVHSSRDISPSMKDWTIFTRSICAKEPCSLCTFIVDFGSDSELGHSLAGAIVLSDFCRVKTEKVKLTLSAHDKNTITFRCRAANDFWRQATSVTNLNLAGQTIHSCCNCVGAICSTVSSPRMKCAFGKLWSRSCSTSSRRVAEHSTVTLRNGRLGVSHSR